MQNQKHCFLHDLSHLHPFSLQSYIARHSGDETICYKMAGQTLLRLSLFFPPGYQKGARFYPVMILVHGGGWNSRKIFSDQLEWSGDYLGYLARYYAESGFISISLDYRLLKEAAPFHLDALYQDCMDALWFLWKKRTAYGLDFQRAYLLGESAGGYLAAAMLTLPHCQSPFAFQGGILANPITDLLDSKWGQFLTGNIVQPTEQQSALCRSFSPVHQIPENLCPILLFHGLSDQTVSPCHSIHFYEAVQRAGQYAELHLLENTAHAFLLTEYSGNNRAVTATIQVVNHFFQQQDFQNSGHGEKRRS